MINDQITARLYVFIRENVKGGCKKFSLGDKCECPLCDLDRLLEASNKGASMSQHTELIASLRAESDELIKYQFSHTKEAMSCLQRLHDLSLEAADALQALERQKQPNDLDYAKAQVRSAGYSLVSAEFITAFAEFIQDWRKGDFDLPKLAALDVKACFDAWQKEVNQNEVKPVLQAQERVPMTTADMVNVVKAAGWPADTNDRQLVAAFNLIEATEAHHNITPPESI